MYVRITAKISQIVVYMNSYMGIVMTSYIRNIYSIWYFIHNIIAIFMTNATLRVWQTAGL